MSLSVPQDPNRRCGFIALIGAPNAGKSTLVNQLVGAKVSIVSRKVQTTRALVRGIMLEDEAQVILVDTPGIFAPKRRLDNAMVQAAWQGAGDADAVALLIDAARGLDEENLAICAKLSQLSLPKILVLNKIDCVPRETLLDLAESLAAKAEFAHVFMVSALKGDGLEFVRKTFAKLVRKGPWLYPEDEVSDMPLRLLASEITREQIFDKLHDELPYQMTVETESWKELKDGSIRIEKIIYVSREGHRKILLGEGGRTIKAIGAASRRQIGEAAEREVHLFLFAKLKPDWGDDPERYRAIGLEFFKE